MPISLPNIFHDFQKKKNPTTQHLKTELCFLFYIQSGIEKPRNLTFPSFPSPIEDAGSFWSHDIQTPSHTHKKQTKER